MVVVDLHAHLKRKMLEAWEDLEGVRDFRVLTAHIQSEVERELDDLRQDEVSSRRREILLGERIVLKDRLKDAKGIEATLRGEWLSLRRMREHILRGGGRSGT